MSDIQNQLDRIMRYANLIQRHAGKAVRPYREDGWVNLLNKYGTSRDTSEQYHFVEEGIVPDEVLSMIYEGNGLFARIIDIPAEEAVKHGFKLKNVNDHCIEDFYMAALDELDWDEVAITSVKWARLFGGSIAVMLINDGRRLEEPVDWRNIKSIDDIRVYDRSVVQPDYDSMYSYDPSYPFGTRGSRLGMPEYYYVNSTYGSFTVHESRCLVFQNGVLPERTSSSIYRLWGMPEYVRIQRAVRDSEVAHGSAVKMLDKSVQPVYKMKDLSMELSTDEGENRVLKRLQSIDTARGMMNTLVVDNDGEDYDFRTFQFAGVADVVNLSDSYLSGLSLIPQTILFGKGVGGLSTTDDTSMENYYNFVDRIRRRMLRPNLRYLLSVIFQAGVATGEVDKVPPINIAFDPLWSLNEIQQADLDLKRAQIRQTNANTSMVYMGQQVISPEEVRKSIAKTGDFEIDATFDDDDMTEEEMNDLIEKIQSNGGLAPSSGGAPEGTPGMAPASEPGGAAPDAAPAATMLPQDMSPEEQAAVQQPTMSQENREYDDENTISSSEEKRGSVGVLVVKDGKILAGIRIGDGTHGLICGPGGHIEAGETPEFAASRETSEEFGIIPNELIFLGRGEKEPETGFEPYLYLCTDYSGEVKTDEEEMTSAEFISLSDLEKISGQLFAPFAYSLKVLKENVLGGNNFDGGPGSGNHGHKGVPGQIGGSAPSEKSAPQAGNSDHMALASDAFRSKKYEDAAEKLRTARKREKELSEKLRTIPSRKPENEWSEDDKMLVEVLGNSYAPVNPEWIATHNEQEKAITECNKADRKARKILLEAEPAPHLKDFDSPKDAAGEYKGFKTNDTGTATDKKGARVVEMSPKEYLERCAAMFNDVDGIETNLSIQVAGLDHDNVKKYAKLMKDGVKFSTPWLDERGINGQEGRHRAAAAYEAGIEKIPVLYWSRNDGFGKTTLDNAGKQATIKAENTDATDDKDIKWITVNGTPVPLKDGKAVGGPLAGKAFSKAKSEAPKEKASSPKKVKASSLKNGFGRTNTSESTGNDSLAKYTDADGNLTPEREKLHASIAESHFEGVKKPKGQPTYTFMGGGPAAGKGSIKKLPDAGYLSGADAVELDPDEIKGKLPEYREMIDAGKDKEAAAYVHEESSALSKRISAVATENGYNVSLDGTGDGSVESMRKKIKAARDAGMRVNGVYVTIPVEEAIRRAEARADRTGRHVPIEKIVDIHRKVSQILPQIAAEFDSVKLYDNSGSKPVLIATGGNGKGLQPVDQKLFDDFINKGK